MTTSRLLDFDTDIIAMMWSSLVSTHRARAGSIALEKKWIPKLLCFFQKKKSRVCGIAARARSDHWYGTDVNNAKKNVCRWSLHVSYRFCLSMFLTFRSILDSRPIKKIWSKKESFFVCLLVYYGTYFDWSEAYIVFSGVFRSRYLMCLNKNIS